MFIRVLKAYIKWRLLAVTLVVFSLLLLFYFTRGIHEKSVSQNSISQSQCQSVYKASPGLPVRLKIPAIEVDAGIQQLGINQLGEMDVPSNIVDVGWFKFGSRPGERGSAVIAGHINGKNGDSGVFANLYKLKAGDKLYIEDDSGTTTTFVVREGRTYNPGYAEEVFSLNDSVHLNLITCDGLWDGNKKICTKRLVIFADIMQ